MATEAARNCEDLTVTLHHRSGERQVCRIPTSEPADVEPEPWTPEFAERLPAGSTNWTGDPAPFIDQLARWGVAPLHDCEVEPGTVLEVGNTVGFVRETNYGALFDVVAEPDPVNLAYTPLGGFTMAEMYSPCPRRVPLYCSCRDDRAAFSPANRGGPNGRSLVAGGDRLVLGRWLLVCRARPHP